MLYGKNNCFPRVGKSGRSIYIRQDRNWSKGKMVEQRKVERCILSLRSYFWFGIIKPPLCLKPINEHWHRWIAIVTPRETPCYWWWQFINLTDFPPENWNFILKQFRKHMMAMGKGRRRDVDECHTWCKVVKREYRYQLPAPCDSCQGTWQALARVSFIWETLEDTLVDYSPLRVQLEQTWKSIKYSGALSSQPLRPVMNILVS